jgi:hypothetical protein
MATLSAYICFWKVNIGRINSFVAEVWQADQESVPGIVARENSCGQAETIKELPTNRQGSVGYCISHY